jgi:cell wall-associated NlpC family hydrolase
VLNVASVPATFSAWLQRAATLCPQIGAPLLAAQLHQESNFNPGAVSPVGAQGAAQFMPGTWPSWGRDDDGNGRVSPFDVGDAVMAQGRYMCALAAQMTQSLAAGRVHGSVADLALAAYNTGPGGVLAAGGIPHNGETDTYVARIDAAIPTFGGAGEPAGPGGPTGGVAVPTDGSFASNVVLAAQRWIGAPYVWGGGDVTGPTGGGFDCSGLVLNAVYTASGGQIRLPHNAAAQSQLATPVTTSQLQPGDLLFFANSAAAPPHHVGIYIGNSQMIDSPDSGENVRISPLTTPYYKTQTITARRFS